MANWTLAPALVQLRAEVNDTWPDRSKASDGTIGDPAHASRTSDHNPNGAGVVRAIDITANGIDAPAYAEHIRKLGAAGHPALQNRGYVIWNRRAAYASTGWKWQKYTGSNPHDKHCHVSVGRDPVQYNDTRSWRIAEIVDPPTRPEGDPFPMLTDEEQKTMFQNTQDIAGELFHYKELSEPVPQTGQRKSQFWEVMVNAEKVPEILRRQVLLEAAVAEQAKTLRAILTAVSPKPPD